VDSLILTKGILGIQDQERYASTLQFRSILSCVSGAESLLLAAF
jgi:hypothetical protein